jgi:hypothetical protein
MPLAVNRQIRTVSKGGGCVTDGGEANTGDDWFAA